MPDEKQNTTDTEQPEQEAAAEKELELERVAEAPAMKTEGGVAYPASDYAYVPDPSKPDTWKLRLTAKPGNVTGAMLGAAAAACAAGGESPIPPADMAKV